MSTLVTDTAKCTRCGRVVERAPASSEGVAPWRDGTGSALCGPDQRQQHRAKEGAS